MIYKSRPTFIGCKNCERDAPNCIVSLQYSFMTSNVEQFSFCCAGNKKILNKLLSLSTIVVHVKRVICRNNSGSAELRNGCHRLFLVTWYRRDPSATTSTVKWSGTVCSGVRADLCFYWSSQEQVRLDEVRCSLNTQITTAVVFFNISGKKWLIN